MKAVIIGVVFLAASIAYLCYEIRRAPLIDSEASRAALDQAMRTVPAQGPTPSNEDCEDNLMADVIGVDKLEALIWATREDPPLSLTWCNPGDVDRIDELVHVWEREQGGR